MPSPEQIVDTQIGAYARGDPLAFASLYQLEVICSVTPSDKALPNIRGVIERKRGQRSDREPATHSHGNRVTSGRSTADHGGVSAGEGLTTRFGTITVDGDKWRSQVWPLEDKVEEPVWW